MPAPTVSSVVLQQNKLQTHFLAFAIPQAVHKQGFSRLCAPRTHLSNRRTDATPKLTNIDCTTNKQNCKPTTAASWSKQISKLTNSLLSSQPAQPAGPYLSKSCYSQDYTGKDGRQCVSYSLAQLSNAGRFLVPAGIRRSAALFWLIMLIIPRLLILLLLHSVLLLVYMMAMQLLLLFLLLFASRAAVILAADDDYAVSVCC